jgi:hypothetical protein
MKFADRAAAGRLLAAELAQFKNRALVVLALPRGGVAVGFEIAQVLRQRDLGTTAIYAKVDREALRTIARPWPGGGV